MVVGSDLVTGFNSLSPRDVNMRQYNESSLSENAPVCERSLNDDMSRMVINCRVINVIC